MMWRHMFCLCGVRDGGLGTRLECKWKKLVHIIYLTDVHSNCCENHQVNKWRKSSWKSHCDTSITVNGTLLTPRLSSSSTSANAHLFMHCQHKIEMIFFFLGGGSPVVERCMCTMQTGTQMTKMKGKKKGLVRFYYLDEHRSCIRWRPSRKQDKAKSKLIYIYDFFFPIL